MSIYLCGGYHIEGVTTHLGREIVEIVMAHNNTFHLRASNYQSRRVMYDTHQGWSSAEINFQPMEVASFELADFSPLPAG